VALEMSMAVVNIETVQRICAAQEQPIKDRVITRISTHPNLMVITCL